VGQPEAVGDAGRDSDRPVDSRCDQTVDALGLRETLDPELVLRRDDRAPVGEPEARRPGIPVSGDDEETLVASRGDETELRGTRA
jgi:hypothetical protein